MAMTKTSVSSPRPLNGAIVRKYVAAGAGVIGDDVYIDANDKAALARGNAAATAWGKGVVVAIEGHMPGTSFVAGQTISVQVFGPIAGWTGMDNTKAIYGSAATAGALTQTAPAGASTWTHVMGYPIRSDVWFIDPTNTPPTANS
jgi:hypothetical protein